MGEIIKLAVKGSNPINSSHALGVPESGATSEGSHLSGPERVMKVSHTLQAYLPSIYIIKLIHQEEKSHMHNPRATRMRKRALSLSQAGNTLSQNHHHHQKVQEQRDAEAR